ncbi:PBS lyase [Hydrococcus rivularis NIES-593]|uniref:PBS lyase n=1 Tax=Hydrococcus rivularis NIES-593 TaxID=1921803 RepID=A0A1U7H7J6_9CYAN|nr:HEAT repeat domain-containing protein [Hydrococcus rivularis]OKH18373.1 PBS lyase [Hydrococcus rivularis NIES-593]
MQKILQNAIAAIQEGNWSSVNQCLQQLLLSPLNKSERKQVIDLALQVLKESDFHQRWEVAKLFPKLGREAIAPLITTLENETTDLETRWFVARILSEFDEPSCIVALVKLLEQTEEEEELSLVASQALAKIGSSAIQVPIGLLKKPETRLLAVRALAQIRRSNIIKPLLEVVNDPNPEIRAIAIEALGSFHDEGILPVLIEALKDPASSVRKEAAIALGMRAQMGSQFDLVELLKPLLYDLNLEVCQQAAMALGRIGTDEAAQALFVVLKSPATPVILKLTLVRALNWIETLQALTYLQQGLRLGDVEVCQEIVTLLGRKESAELKGKATQILIEFFHSQKPAVQQPQIQQALAMSLGELGQTEAIPVLLNLAENSDRTVKLHAIAALKKFPNPPIPNFKQRRLSW